MVGFGVYGFAVGAPSTPAYELSVAALVVVVVMVRKAPLPGALVIALAVDALVHLAGGLVQVGGSGLYNVGIGATSSSWHSRFLQYDHGAHAFGSFLGALALWVLLAPPAPDAARRRELTVLCVLAGMGIGAFNELIEFIATLAHAGAHVGGYDNTGWDLVSNTVGALAAGVVIARHHERLTSPA
jgi:uncharacterized membrane protein YjdF